METTPRPRALDQLAENSFRMGKIAESRKSRDLNPMDGPW